MAGQLGRGGILGLISLVGGLGTAIAALVGPVSEWVQQRHELALAHQQQDHAMLMDFLKQVRESHTPEERRDVLTFYAEVLPNPALAGWAKKELAKAEQRTKERDALREELAKAKNDVAAWERKVAEAAAIQDVKPDPKAQETLEQAEVETAKARARVQEKVELLKATTLLEQAEGLPEPPVVDIPIQAQPVSPASRYYVQVGAISGTDGRGLVKEAEQLREQTLPASVFASATGGRHFMVLGPYALDVAEAVASGWRKQGKGALLTVRSRMAAQIYP
jgi:hypothetical protein